MFVGAKRLKAGDAVLFIRYKILIINQMSNRFNNHLERGSVSIPDFDPNG